MIDRRALLASAAAAGLTAALPGAARASSWRDASLEAKLGRMIVLGFLGDHAEAGDAQAIEAHLASGRIGGVLFLRHNARSREGVDGLARRFRAASPTAWLTIDQEGGLVQRLTDEMGYGDIPRAMDLAGLGLDAAREAYGSAARELKSAGFNLNLAPVADLHQDDNLVIGRYGRAYGADPHVVAQYCAAFIEAFEAQNIACAIKHFPGHGRSAGDSHDGFVDITESWTFEELVPFADLIRSGHAHLIMGGHLINRRIEPSGDPITFSSKAFDGLLRDVMGYDGAVITDDLDMGAIREHYDRREAVLGALRAGNDLLLISNSADPDPRLPQNILEWVEESIEAGDLSMADIDAAMARLDALELRVLRS